MSDIPLSFRSMRTSLVIAALFGATAAGISLPQLVSGGDVEDPKDESTARKAQREENLKAMSSRAAAVHIVPAGAERPAAELIAKPLFHYSDEPRRIVDATLWGWMVNGRVQAVCKIEKYDYPQPERQWLYCFGSASTGLLDVDFRGEGRRWASRKPGIEMQPLGGAPAPAESKVARLRQMKESANRFHATILVDDKTKNTQEMRLLPQPVFRYEKPAGEVVDGAIFGLTTNGTNPDALLVLELHKAEDKAAAWRFGVAGMTAGGLTVKLDDKEVWTKPFVGNTGTYETWLWFFSKPSE